MKVLLPLAISVIFLITGCETGYKGDINSSTDINSSFEIHRPKASYIPTYKEPLSDEFSLKSFDGGIESDGLDIGKIRVSQSGDLVRVVFDIYKWDEKTKSAKEKVNFVGSYSVDYDPSDLLITAIIHGYRGFSAKLPKFSKDSVVESIDFEKIEENGYRFYIKLRDDATVKVFDLKNPGRIVFDITRQR